MDIMQQSKLITCIVPKGVGSGLQKALIEKWDLQAANIHNARGVGRNMPMNKRGVGEQLEKEVLEVTVAEDIADAVFEFTYNHLELSLFRGGMIYMATQQRSTVFEMPEMPEEV